MLLKRILNSMRNYLVLFAAILPVLFVVISLIIEQQIPKPQDSPALFISLDRYKSTKVPYTYDRNQTTSIDFIRAYEHAVEHSTKPATLIDLTTNDGRPCQDGKLTNIISYLLCIGKRSLLELSDQYLIGANVQVDASKELLNITGLFNNQPYHVPPLTLNFITNALVKQYSTTPNTSRTINVINHPVDLINAINNENLILILLVSTFNIRSFRRFSIAAIFWLSYGIKYCVWFRFYDGIVFCILD